MPEDELAEVGNAPPEGWIPLATAWPQLNRHWQEASGSSPRTSILLAALKSRPSGLGGVWRRAAMCGCAGVTRRGRVGGGVLVLAARRPFQTWR